MIKVSMTAHLEVEEDDAHLKNLVDFEISNHPPEGKEGKELIKVKMTAYLELEEDDGLGNIIRKFTLLSGIITK